MSAARSRRWPDPRYTDDFDATWRDVLAGCQGLLDQIIIQEG
ncbi:MAG: hypothetical protein ACLR0P_08875 [Oscillospiraceae bacterium]